MFRLADKLNQAIAFTAILLALSSLAQNAGLYCYLGACEAELVASSVEDGSCCHHHATHGQEQPAPPCKEPFEHDSCPCPESCWCHQVPQPFELPKTFDEPLELAFLGVFAICNDFNAGSVSEQRTFVACAVPPDLGDKSTIDRCAKLCRFLI